MWQNSATCELRFNPTRSDEWPGIRNIPHSAEKYVTTDSRTRNDRKILRRRLNTAMRHVRHYVAASNRKRGK